ncbi:MAG TPA: hypothetical protein EYH31_07440, partial [Anaerolineae bacterium]|nr:hypothetical protein [Anaerolineae bacterium]
MCLLTLLVQSVIAWSPSDPAIPAVNWSGFAPTDWVSSVPFSASVTASDPVGLQASTAVYRTSTDAGVSWGNWTNIGLATSGATTQTLRLTVEGLNLPESADTNRIGFRIENAEGTPSVSPAYLLRVDLTPPASTITFPSDGGTYSSVSEIRGTADPDTGAPLVSVEVSIRDGNNGTYWNGSSWTPDEAWLTAVGTDTWSLSSNLPAWTDGRTYALRSQASDAAGNVETPTTAVAFSIDATGPSVTLLSPNGDEAWQPGSTHDITWDASDPAGLLPNPITLTVSWDGGGSWQRLADHLPNSGSWPWTVPFTESSQVLVQVAATDKAGNASADHSDAPFVVDGTPPGPPIGLTANPADWSRTGVFTLTWIVPDDLSGAVGARYTLDSPPISPYDGTYAFAPNGRLEGVRVADEGEHTLYLWLTDRAGNADASTAVTVVLRYDGTPPAPPFGLSPSPSGWTNMDNFSLSWLNPPDLSGIVGARYKLDAEPIASDDGTFVAAQNQIQGIHVGSEGSHDVYLWLVDRAGNTNHLARNVLPNAFHFDGTAPQADADLAGTPGEGGWYVSPVTVTLTAVDATSGLSAIAYRLDSGAWITEDMGGAATGQVDLSISADGQHTLEAQGLDRAGNVTHVSPVTVGIDQTPPTTDYALTGTLGPGGWYTDLVTIDLLPTDAASGVAASFYRLDDGPWVQGAHIELSEDGRREVRFYSVDAAGNVEASQSVTVPVDRFPPSTAYLILGTPGDGIWFRSPVTVELQPDDAGSGVVSTFYQVDGGAWQPGTHFSITADGEHTIAFYSVDAIGHVETAYPVDVAIDREAPATPNPAQAQPDGWTNVNSFTLIWSKEQDLSGIAGAYYRLGSPPLSPTDGQYVTHQVVEGVTVPAEGAYDVYLWLRDGAGNVDHTHRSIAQALLRYDATPPTTTLNVTGTLGWNGWYTSPLAVRLSAEDELSGVAATRYSLDGGPWQVGSSLVLTTADKHTLRYRSIDVAGNEETLHSVTLRVDTAPPPPPIDPVPAPLGWTGVNDFSVSWRVPVDLSGIAGAYYKLDTPPMAPRDGTYVPSPNAIRGITVTSDGQHDLYLWLMDNAGNTDHRQRVYLPTVFWYDSTPPTTAATLIGKLGRDGWYVSPVTVSLVAYDNNSGVALTRYRLDDGQWEVGTSLVIQDTGVHQLYLSSSDAVGNEEPPQVRTVRVDGEPPHAWITGMNDYQYLPTFVVRWEGQDQAAGSGLASYEVQFRDGAGIWQTWFSSTTATSATFQGQRGHTYAFRVRARDRAGNLGRFQGRRDGEMAATFVDPIVNGDFSLNDFTGWQVGGPLERSVLVPGPMVGDSPMAQLGTPAYGRSPDEPGTVPIGPAAITQTVGVPPANLWPTTWLHFRYRIQTYDVVWSKNRQQYFDSFDFDLRAADGSPLRPHPPQLWVERCGLDGPPLADLPVLRDGNCDLDGWAEDMPLVDLGWREVYLDLSSYAGQEVRISFANWNRVDHLFNT